MINFASANRQDDMALLISQDNKQKKIIINSGNEKLLKVSEYSQQELMNKKIEEVFDSNTIRIITEHLDYTDEMYSIGSILSKVRNCKIITAQNQQINITLKVFHAISQPDILSFELLIRTQSLFDQFKQYRRTALEDHSYHLIPEINIMDTNTTMQEIDLLQQFHMLYGSESLIGTITINNDKLHLPTIQKVVATYKKCTRDDDMIGHFHDNILLFIIFDCKQEFFESVIRRIYHEMDESLEKPIKIQYANLFEYQIFINEQRIIL